MRVIWRVVPYSYGLLQVSNLGDVRKANSNAMIFNIKTLNSNKYAELECEDTEISRQDIMPTKYVKYKTEYGKTLITPLSPLVYAAFHGIFDLDYMEILHKDGNEFNNSIDNLILSNKSSKIQYLNSLEQNRLSAMLPGPKNLPPIKSKLRPFISEYNLNGMRQNVYTSANEAGKKSGIEVNYIASAINAIKTLQVNNRIFKLGIGPECVDTQLIRTNTIVVSNSSSLHNNRKVFKYTTAGRLSRIYNNLFEAAFHEKIAINRLQQSFKSFSACNNHIWMLGND